MSSKEESSDEDTPKSIPLDELVPKFYRTMVQIWFRQFESILSSYKATLSDDFKYAFVITKMEKEDLIKIKDFVINPPDKDKYNSLKKRIMLQELLLLKLDGKQPSKLLESMKCYQVIEFSDEALKLLWLEKLPMEVRFELSKNLNLSMNELKSLADLLMEQHTNKLTEIEKLAKQIEELKLKVDGLCVESKEKNSCSSSSSESPKKQQCWYHIMYGDDARNCVSPCWRKQTNNNKVST